MNQLIRSVHVSEISLCFRDSFSSCKSSSSDLLLFWLVQVCLMEPAEMFLLLKWQWPWQCPLHTLMKSWWNAACYRLSYVPPAAGDRRGDGRVHWRGPDVRSHGGVQQAPGPRLHPAGREEPELLHRHVLCTRHSELTPECKHSAEHFPLYNMWQTGEHTETVKVSVCMHSICVCVCVYRRLYTPLPEVTLECQRLWLYLCCSEISVCG